MQILYWHLTRPQTSTCAGSLSPPLLQRRDKEPSLSTRKSFVKKSTVHHFPVSSHTSLFKNSSLLLHPSSLTILGRKTGGRNQSSHKAMEIENEEQMPTFYLLNAVDLPEDEDSALNHHLNLIHGHQNSHDNSYSGPLVGNGSSGDGGGGGGGGPPGGHYSDQLHKGSSGKRKKRRSNDLARVLSIEDEEDGDGDDDSFVNIGPSKSKKAKLVVNLYPEDKGYSLAYQVPGSNQCSETYAIPYSERYLLDSIDHEQIPNKVLCDYEDRKGVCLMRYRNQVITEIRDYRKSLSSQSTNGSNTNTHHVPSPSADRNNSASPVANGSLSGESEKKKPVVKQVMLRPTNESLLCDFDLVVEKGEQDRGGWCAVLRQSSASGNLSYLLADGSDSENEYEVDLEASQQPKRNYLTYEQRLELERKFVNQTADPICLDPSPQVSIIANRMQYEKFKWNTEELEEAAKRWGENPFKDNVMLVSTSDTSLNAPSLAEGRLNVDPFHNYVVNARKKKEVSSRTYNILDKDFVKLPPISYLDYPPGVDPPKNKEEILRIGQTPEPAQLRLFPNENFVRKIEEYILETERRKRPHTTTLSIFQRNGMESYFGELEMESFLDPNQPRIGTAPASTKCQFELGSSRNVTLYVKQFSDIFTEDGRRPCKITYQKVGQAPQVVYTNSYKSAAAAATTPAPQPAVSVTKQQAPNQTATTVTTSQPQTVTLVSTSVGGNSAPASTVTATVVSSPQVVVSSAAQVIQVQAAGPGPAASTASVTIPGIVTIQQQSPQPAQATTTAPSLPPVQIVHPQPRTTPQLQQKAQQATVQRQGAIQIFSQQQPNQAQNNATAQAAAQSAANVNLNVNLTPQQVLTRPNIVNVNLQHQQQQQNAAAQQQLLQLTQQRILRMKQQQPNTALAKLLLSNLQQSKPITVAVQPTPQTPTNVSCANNGNNNNNSVVCSSASASASCGTNSAGSSSNVVIASSPVDQQQSQQNNPLGSPMLIQSPPSVSSVMTNPSPNVNVNVNASPNESVNLNTISLDGLLAASSAGMNFGNVTTLTTNQAGSNIVSASNMNLGLSRITTSTGQPAVNILRLNNNTGTVTSASGGNTVQLATLQRQFAALNGNVSILQQGRQQPQQRILINANSVNNLNLNSVGSSGEMDELSVPDLQTLLGGQPIQISQLGQQQHILTNAAGSGPSQTTIDTTNLNLNLNVNLNSGTVVNNGDSQMQQHQIAKIQGGEWTTTAQAPPFLVFISPLRPMSIATPAGAAVTRQVTTSTGTLNNSSTLNLNLGAMQQQQQSHQAQIVQSQPGKVPEGPTRILLGTCNNGVAIKREVATSSASTASSAGDNSGSSSNANLNQNQNQNRNQAMEGASVDGHLLDSHHGVVDGVDSLFNALSEAIGPEQLQKLDAIGGSLAAASSGNTSHHSSISGSSGGGGTMVDTVAGMNVVVPSSIAEVTTSTITIPSSISNTSNNTAKNNSTNVITLSDLLGSPTVVSSSTGNTGSSFPSLILTSVSSNNSSSSVMNSSPTLSSLLNSVTSTIAGIPSYHTVSSASIMTQSSIVSSTPRLSALLAGTPSADTVVVGSNGPSSILSPASSGIADSSQGGVGGAGPTINSASYGSLLDRLAASLNQPQGTTAQVRTGASRLNPIATATPNVVLDHPVLAATLTQQQQQQQQLPGSPTMGGVNRGTATYRQIAPAPSPVSGVSSSTTTSSSNVAVISSSDIQSHAIQSPQLINLLGLVGNSAGSGQPGQTRTIRISTSSAASSNPSPGSTSR